MAVILKDENDKELFRKDLQKNTLDAFFRSNEEWHKIWVEYNGPLPYKWIVWPYSEKHGWTEYREGLIANAQS